MDDNKSTIPCMNQIIKTGESVWRKDGQGDCSVCKCDEKNKECSAYNPVRITINTFEVK